MDQLTKLTPVIFLVIGLGGSLHCLGMCGPLILSSTKNKTENFLYQIGRLIGYISIGLAIKSLGVMFFNKSQTTLIIAAGVLLGLFYIIQGLALLKIIAEVKINLNLHKYLFKLKVLKSPIGTGFISAFLPCGLLYTTLFSLLVIQDMKVALFSLIMFWLGTLPLLLFSTVLFEKTIRPFVLKVPKIAGTLILTFGLMTVVVRLIPLMNGSKTCAHCYIK